MWKKKKIGYGEEKIVNLGGKVTFSTFSLLVSTFAPLFPKKCNLRNVQRYLYISLISSRWVDTIMHCCLMPANYTLASTSHGNTLLKLPPCTFQTTERHTHASVRKKKVLSMNEGIVSSLGFRVILNPNLMQIRWGSVVGVPLSSHGAIMW